MRQPSASTIPRVRTPWATICQRRRIRAKSAGEAYTLQLSCRKVDGTADRNGDQYEQEQDECNDPSMMPRWERTEVPNRIRGLHKEFYPAALAAYERAGNISCARPRRVGC